MGITRYLPATLAELRKQTGLNHHDAVRAVRGLPYTTPPFSTVRVYHAGATLAPVERAPRGLPRPPSQRIAPIALAMLRQRPVTAADVAAEMGCDPCAALRVLRGLVDKGAAAVVGRQAQPPPAAPRILFGLARGAG